MIKKRKSKKKNSRVSVAGIFKFFLLPVVAVLFSFLFLKAEIKFLNKEIYNNEKKIEVLQNQLEEKLVDVQKLSAEERIVKIAKQKLSMVRINNSVENIFVSKLKIIQIQKIVDSKYD